MTLSEVPNDYAGGARPFGSAYDIGAYEFGSPPDSGGPPTDVFLGGGSSTPPVFYSPDGKVYPSGYN